MSKTTVTVPFLPPSVNEVYKFNRKTGAMYMVKEASAFKKGFAKFMQESYLKAIHSFDTKSLYKANYTFVFLEENLINAKFGTDGRVKSRYKNVDVDNRVKLQQDCLASSFGFNDSQIFEFTASKKIGKTEQLIIELEKVELASYAITDKGT